MQKHLHDKPTQKKPRAKAHKTPHPAKHKAEHHHIVEPRSGEGHSPMEGAHVEGERIEGEGSYTAARRYDAAVRDFIESGEVEPSARKAEEALEGPEGKSLTEAERVGKRGEPEAH